MSYSVIFPGFAGQRDFIQTAFAAHDQNMFGAKLLQYAGKNAAQVDVEHAQELVCRAGRIGQRAQDIEDAAESERTADRGNIAHGAVMVGREHKADTGLLDALGNLFGVEVEVGAHLFHDIGSAAG